MKQINRIFLSLFLFLASFQAFSKDYMAMDFGVKNDGITLNTCSIQKAIDFIHEKGAADWFSNLAIM